ncbi:MAG: NADH-quinone oxidoreductase subunit E, partial [Acidimicrobiaceae bacterium]|nr:NADH-quinone oxidoreductase subunit E [Acidimicrobiaceae bacterium]
MTDIYLGADRATDAEAAAVDEALRDRGVDAVVQPETERLYTSGRSRRDERRHYLLPALHALQNAVGWISPGGVNYVAEVLGVPPAEAFGVATFYDLFRTEPPDHDGDTFHVCVDAACQIAGYDDLVASVRASGGHVHLGPCLGQCERAPALFVQGTGGRPDYVPADAEPFELPQAGDPSLRLLRRIGVADPESLESYRAHGGYEALQRAGEMGADAVLEAVAASGLSGRGGAAFPTGVKWRAVAAETGRPKHVVANCDESEPGTFKD